MYVVDLVVDDTVNTMPEKTLEAVADHGEVAGDQVPAALRRRAAHLDALAEAGHRLRRRDRGRSRRRASTSSSTSWHELLDTVRAAAGRGEGVVVSRRPVDPTLDRRRGRGSATSPTASPPTCGRWFADDPGRVERLDLHRGRPAGRPVQGPGRRRRAGRAARRWPTRSGSPSGATRCSAASGSTSPRTGPCCTPRCACPRTPRSRSTARTSSPTSTTCCAGSTTSPTRSARAPGPASPASGSAPSSTSASAAPTSGR